MTSTRVTTATAHLSETLLNVMAKRLQLIAKYLWLTLAWGTVALQSQTVSAEPQRYYNGRDLTGLPRKHAPSERTEPSIPKTQKELLNQRIPYDSGHKPKKSHKPQKHKPHRHNKQNHKRHKPHKRPEKHGRAHYHGRRYCVDYHYDYHDDYHDYYHPPAPARWTNMGTVRTRKNRDVDRVVNIHRRAAAIELNIVKRSAYVRRAYVEFGNGSVRRIRNLEGYLEWGEPLIHHFRHNRKIARIHLELSPAQRGRGYLSVNIKEYH